MKRKNLVAMVTSVALVGVVAVGGTLALLTSNTPDLKNTFTIGNGYPGANALTLDEAYVKRDTSVGKNFGGWIKDETQEGRNPDGFEYDLVAGTTVWKDPTFHLAANSPDSWIVAYVDGIEDLKDKVNVSQIPDNYNWGYLGTDLDDSVIEENVNSADTLKDGYYVFKTTVSGGESTQALFDQLTVLNAALNEQSLPSIVVKGVAVESVTGYWVDDPNTDEVVETAEGDAIVAAAKTVLNVTPGA